LKKKEEDDDKERKEVRLEKKDYVAILIAALQTIFLPFIIIVIILFAIAILLGFI
jgi:hypothetical protein